MLNTDLTRRYTAAALLDAISSDREATVVSDERHHFIETRYLVQHELERRWHRLCSQRQSLVCQPENYRFNNLSHKPGFAQGVPQYLTIEILESVSSHWPFPVPTQRLRSSSGPPTDTYNMPSSSPDILAPRLPSPPPFAK